MHKKDRTDTVAPSGFRLQWKRQSPAPHNELWWCLNGTYLVYRKVKENMPVWEAFADEMQEGMIGRKKDTGEPLWREKEGTGVDALYGKGVLSTIDGGYYFCPPGLKDEQDFLGSTMFND